jgi:mRNA-degrading endonuclease RelE of RelBE toxin-antitoxin system
MAESARYKLTLEPDVERIFKSVKRKNPDLFRDIEFGVIKILRSPELGKPMRNILSNQRRIHVAGSFVLLYEIAGTEVRLLDFDHHDKIYKKHTVRQ